MRQIVMIVVALAFARNIGHADEEVWLGTAPFCKASPDDCKRKGMEYVRSDKHGDGSKCASGTKVLCRRPQEPVVEGARAEMWVGKAPACQGHKDDCALMDFEYVRDDQRGDGSACVTGHKVLCRARHPPCDPQAFLTDHPPPLTRVERAWGKVTDAMKNAGIGGSWQHLGSTRITGCILQAATSDGFLGDKWRTLDVRIQSVCGRPVNDKRYIRIEVMPKTAGYDKAMHSTVNDVIATGGEFGYDWPHRVPDDGLPLREIRPTNDFGVIGKTSSKCE